MAIFSESYFQGEIREDFYVEPMMKCTWAAEIEVLETVARICEKHNIRYFAEYGTLLGAVRHRGFIPWDDDIDISMLRSDYERFRAIAPAELPAGWHIHNVYTNPFHQQLHARITNGDKIDYSPEHLRRFHGCPFSVGLDLFPLDTLAPTPQEDQAICSLLKILVHTAQIYEEYPSQAIELLPEIEDLCGITFDRSHPIKGQLMQLADQVSQTYNNSGADEVSHYAIHAKREHGLRLKAAWYNDRLPLPFETITIMAPAGYDAILRQTYGDYMTPVRGTQSHEYPFWKKQERIMAECLQDYRKNT